MDHYNRSQEDGMGMPVPLANYNPQPQNPIRVSAFSKPSSSSSLILSPKDGSGRNGSANDFTTATNDHHPLHHHTHNPDHQINLTPNTTAASNSKQPTTPTSISTNIKYRECLRNHAASIGGHVLDGCCEFMPSSTDALKCAACDCHRSFHRKHTDGESGPYYRSRDRISVPLLLPPPPPPAAVHHHSQSHHHQKQFSSSSAFPHSPSGVVIGSSPMVAFGGNNSGSGATTESSSEERMDAGVCEPLSSHQGTAMIVSQKRYRTKFTAEQKERMMGFAERLGWRFQRQDDAAVEQFCKETGIRRQVFKVWMHNNKHSMRKQQQEPMQQHVHHHLQTQPQPQQVAPEVDSAITTQPLPPPPPPLAATMFGHARN